MDAAAVFFDLDGTLLPMDQEIFTKKYFELMAGKMKPYGYDPKKLVDAIWTGTSAMVKNDGRCSNEEVFWRAFAAIFGQRRVEEDRALFEDFYAHEFDGARTACGYQPMAAQIIRGAKRKGLRVALATNPIFPAIATQKRIQWAGLDAGDFELYTTYENSRFCKPNLDYYRAILAELGLRAEACLMVGNDVSEDMTARELGMKVFLLTDCLINKTGQDIAAYPHGGFGELARYLGVQE